MGTPPDRDDPQQGQGGWQSSGWQSSWQQPQGGQGWQQPQEPGSSGHPSGWQQSPDGQWVQTGGSQSHGKATAALVLGILGLLLCPLIFSILALVFGYRSRRDIDASNGRLTGRGNATAGIVLGWIGIALTTVLLILILIGVLAGDSETTSPSSAPTVLVSLAA